MLLAALQLRLLQCCTCQALKLPCLQTATVVKQGGVLSAKPYTFKVQFLNNGKLQTFAKKQVNLAQYCSCEQQGNISVALNLECVPGLL